MCDSLLEWNDLRSYRCVERQRRCNQRAHAIQQDNCDHCSKQGNKQTINPSSNLQVFIECIENSIPNNLSDVQNTTY